MHQNPVRTKKKVQSFYDASKFELINPVKNLTKIRRIYLFIYLKFILEVFYSFLIKYSGS